MKNETKQKLMEQLTAALEKTIEAAGTGSNFDEREKGFHAMHLMDMIVKLDGLGTDEEKALVEDSIKQCQKSLKEAMGKLEKDDQRRGRFSRNNMFN